jgi:CTP synthase (UTP-ammonia lyase)
MLVEHARNLLGIDAASHAEYGAGGVEVVSLLSCSLTESQIEIAISPGTTLASIHPGEARRVERTHCSYGLAPDFAHVASSRGMRVSAIDDTGEVRAVERADHPFFIGTLYQPQRTSSPDAPHPLWVAFVGAVAASGATTFSRG